MSVHPKRPNTFDGGSEASSGLVGGRERQREKDCVGRFPVLPYGLLSGTAAASLSANCKRIKNASPTTQLHTRKHAHAYFVECVYIYY
jgi:hypothetical protein